MLIIISLYKIMTQLIKNKNNSHMNLYVLQVTSEDLMSAYDVSKNKFYLSGQKTKEQIFNSFLNNFEIGGHVDGTVTLNFFFLYI